MRLANRVVILVAAVSLAGCSSFMEEALDAAGRTAGEGVGSAVGERMGQAAGNALAARIPTDWSANLTPVYVNYLFTTAFHSGSYTFEGMEYDVGEWTRWRLEGTGTDGQPHELERAFLARTDANLEWWRVKYVSETQDQGRDSITLEGLFNPVSGEFVRMRGKMPGEEAASEIPVTEGAYVYREPQQLRPESVEGATVGTEDIRVPAGSFTARHVRYSDMGGGTYQWWLVDDVPGGLVKYSRSYDAEDTEGMDPYNWVVTLMDSGTGAESQLGTEF